MKNKNTLWQRIVFLEEKLTENQKKECRQRALDITPIDQTDGFREPTEYHGNYLTELKEVYDGK